MKPISLPWLAGVLSAWSIAAGAQTQEPVNPPVTTTTTTTTSTPVETRIVNSFSAWAGSEDNARSLVTGLRQGSEITLTTPTSSGLPGSGTPAPGAATTGTASSSGISFTPPTRPMGYGNVRIALSLAREQLAQSGITQPTPAQLEAALMGGTTTTGTATGTGGAATTTASFPGVLQMRADGMGWGQIANSMGVKLGHVMSGRTSPPPAVPPADSSGTASTGSGGSTGAATSTRSGITTSAGSTSTTATTRSRGNSAAAHQAHRPGAGIVTAAGGSTAGLSAGANANGGGNSAGVVTAAGAASGSRASATGRAHGKAHIDP